MAESPQSKDDLSHPPQPVFSQTQLADQGAKQQCRSLTDSLHTDGKEGKLRAVYDRLFQEMQFRATKNALMNYHEAKKLKTKSHYNDIMAHSVTFLSATGILGSAASKGKTLFKSKAGVIGMIGLPISGILQLANSSTSKIVPSSKEVARKHVMAAAGWNHVSESARVIRLRMLVDPEFDLDIARREYEQMLQKREEVSKLVLISEETFEEYNNNVEAVFLAMKKRTKGYNEFSELEKEYDFGKSDVEKAHNIYF